jgi:hypothetical protein
MLSFVPRLPPRPPFAAISRRYFVTALIILPFQWLRPIASQAAS